MVDQTHYRGISNEARERISCPSLEISYTTLSLIDEIRTLGVDFGKVHDTGLEYIDALGEVEKAEEEAAHAEEKTAKCLDTYTDTLRLAKETLWFKFAYVEIKLYADGAEEKCAEVERTDVNELPEEDCQVLRESLEERISMLERKVLEWETIVSEASVQAAAIQPGKQTA
ncbi:unnamed protein product [Arctogadus glacialis]